MRVREWLAELNGRDAFGRLLERLTPEDVEDLVLLAFCEEAPLREQARGVLVMLEHRGDRRLFQGSAHGTWNAAALEEYFRERAQSPEIALDAATFEELFPVENEMRLPVSGGQALVLSPGQVRCSLVLTVVSVAEAIHDTSDKLMLEVRITDCEGIVYRAKRTWGANILLLTLPRNRWAPPTESLELIARGVRVFDDSRDNLPVLTHIEGVGYYPFAYRSKYLYLMLDLYRWNGRLENGRKQTPDSLVIRVRPARLGSVMYSATPSVVAAVDWLASMALCPALAMNWHHPGDALEFVRSEDVGEGQPGVRCVSAVDA
jgi:hypothetical protein